MSTLKERILTLRSQGLTYSQIVNELGCSKSRVCYYCGEGQKEKTKIRNKKSRNDNHLLRVTNRFCEKKLQNATRDFQRRKGDGVVLPTCTYSFHVKDVLAKFGQQTTCYLTGRKIDLRKDREYEFDHIIPLKNGGSGEIDNLGIVAKPINKMKSTLGLEEFIQLCKEVVIHNGYDLVKRD